MTDCEEIHLTGAHEWADFCADNSDDISADEAETLFAAASSDEGAEFGGGAGGWFRVFYHSN